MANFIRIANCENIQESNYQEKSNQSAQNLQFINKTLHPYIYDADTQLITVTNTQLIYDRNTPTNLHLSDQ